MRRSVPVLPWSIVPGTFIWLTLDRCGNVHVETRARVASRPHWPSWLRSYLTVNPYHLVIVYYRSDFAELLAGAFFPLMVWCALHAARGEWRRVPLLASAFAGIWLSNAPAAVIATYSLSLIFVVECAVRRSLRPLVPGAAGMAAGLSLAAFYILPAAWERRWVEIAQALADNLRPAQNFLFTHANDPDFVRFNWKVSSVAVGVMIVTGLAAIFAAKKRREFSELFWVLITLGAVSIALMLPLSNPLWRALPELRFVQFPWRWLEILDLVFAFLVAAAIAQLQRRRVAWFAGAVVFLAIGAAATAMVRNAWWDSADVPSLASAIHSSRGYEGTDEYMPVGSDRYELPGNPDDTDRDQGVSAVPALRIAEFDTASGEIVPAADVKLQIERWSAADREFVAETAMPVTLAVKLLKYPAWEVRVDGQEIRASIAPDTGQMLVALPSGTHRVAMQFGQTWDRSVGSAVSVLSAITLLVWLWKIRRPTDDEAAR